MLDAWQDDLQGWQAARHWRHRFRAFDGFAGLDL